MRACTSAELWQITGVTGFTAWSACWFQLHSNIVSNRYSKRQRHSEVKTNIWLAPKRDMDRDIPNAITVINFVTGVNLSRCPASYLTVLATLSMGTDSIPLQSASSGIAAGIHTLLKIETHREKATRQRECAVSEVEQK